MKRMSFTRLFLVLVAFGFLGLGNVSASDDHCVGIDEKWNPDPDPQQRVEKMNDCNAFFEFDEKDGVWVKTGNPIEVRMCASDGLHEYSDDGGRLWNYTESEPPRIWIFCPDDKSRTLQMEFTEWGLGTNLGGDDLEGADVFEVYDGVVKMDPDNPGHLIFPTVKYDPKGEANVPNAPNGGKVLADGCDDENPRGCLSVLFDPTKHSDDWEVGEGWVFKLTCEKKPIKVIAPDDTSPPTVHLLGGLGVCAFQGAYTPPAPTIECKPEGAPVFVAMLPAMDAPDPVVERLLAEAVQKNQVPNGKPFLFVPELQGKFPDERTGCFTYFAVYIVDANCDGKLIDDFRMGWFDVQKLWVCPPALVCNVELNVALNADCTAFITPDHLLEDPCLLDLLHYDIHLFDEHGNRIADNLITMDHIGKRVKAVVTDRFGKEVNSCWTQLNVQDNISPSIEDVPDDYIFCGMDNASGPGIVNWKKEKIQDEFEARDNCGVAVEVGPWSKMDLDCRVETPVRHGDKWFRVVGKWTRVITARATKTVGPHSNETATTIQRVLILQPDLIFPKNALVECTGGNEDISPEALEDDEVPHFVTKGDKPMRMRIPLDHIECGYAIEFKDGARIPTNCGYKVFRTWTIFNWCTGTLMTSPEPHIQVIEVKDTEAPVFECPKDVELGGKDNPIIVSTGPNPFSCTAEIDVPAPPVFDDCVDRSGITIHRVLKDLAGNPVPGGFEAAVLKKACEVVYVIEYTAEDRCGNVSDVCKQFIKIVDDDKPVCHVNEFHVIPVNDGAVTICATNLDKSSYDNCGIKVMEIKKMGTADPFAPCITLSCADLFNDEEDNEHDVECPGTVNVLFRVEDNCGNESTCMIEIELQDKTPPTISISPQELVFDCDKVDLHNLEGLFGNPTAADNCKLKSVTPSDSRNIDDCGQGTITRVWTAEDFCGLKTTTRQTVRIRHISDFIAMIPPDVDEDCSQAGLIDQYLDAQPGDPFPFWPQISDDECEKVLITKHDEIYSSGAEVCLKIIRTWKIANWCINPRAEARPFDDIDLGNGKWQDGGNGYMEFRQIIKLNDSEKPVITCPAEVTVEDRTIGCEGPINIQASATDNCTPADRIRITYRINNGPVKVGNVVNEILPYGTHTILFTATDDCGNTNKCTTTVTILDRKKPGIVCSSTLSAELMPIDLDGDGSIDGGMAEVWAREFVVSYSDNCPTSCDPKDENTTCFLIDNRFGSDPLQPYGPNPPSEPPASAQPGLTFDCNDGPGGTVAIWARDEAGNWDFCSGTLELQDNMNACCVGPNCRQASIAGTIETEQKEMVDNVTVNLSDDTQSKRLTGLEGLYEFRARLNSSYTVTPEKDIEHLNGVSTFDVVLISKHILGQSELNSPYKLIAADVDKSGYISGNDLVQIRQLILNKTQEFPNNTSWRFVDKNYIFPDQSNPWSAPFPEVINIGDLTDDMRADFLGIKIGDVSGDARANRTSNLLGSQVRNSAGTLTFSTNDAVLNAGQSHTVEFRAEDIVKVAGYQFALNFNPQTLEFVDVVEGALPELTTDNFGLTMLDEGIITTSWNSDLAGSLAADEVLFSLTFTAKTDVQLSEALSLSSRYTAAEAYSTDLIPMEVSINFDGATSSADEFALYQNRPNPFQNSTVIGFTLPEDGQATLNVFDVSGKLIKQVQGNYIKGYNEISISRSELSAVGVMYYQLSTATESATRKMIMID